jgi:hypothetical protein
METKIGEDIENVLSKIGKVRQEVFTFFDVKNMAANNEELKAIV